MVKVCAQGIINEVWPTLNGSALVVHPPLKGKSTVILPWQAIFKNFSPTKVGGNGSLFTPPLIECFLLSSMHIWKHKKYSLLRRIIRCGCNKFFLKSSCGYACLIIRARPLCLWCSVYPTSLEGGQPTRQHCVVYFHVKVIKDHQDIR